MTGFIPLGRPGALQIAGGIVVWGFAIVIPAVFLIMGVARMAAVIDALTSMRPRKVTPQLASALGPEHVAATDLVLPGGRRLHELVVGPFGIVVLGAVPPPAYSRHVGTRWEVRDDRGRWIPIEDPIQRASRDAERVRGWIADGGPRLRGSGLRRRRDRGRARRPLVDLRRRRAGRARGVARGAAAATRPDPEPARPRHRKDRLAGGALSASLRRAGGVVGEPGLEPGTSGI